MGDYKAMDEMGHKPSKNGHSHVYSPAHWRSYSLSKRPRKKVETKLIGLVLCDLLGFTGILNGILSKIDSWQEVAMALIATLYLLARLVFYVIKNWIAVKKELRAYREGKK